MERFKGRKFLLASHKRRPVALFVRTEPRRKIAFTFFDFARAGFSSKRGSKIFCEAGRRSAAAGGGQLFLIK